MRCWCSRETTPINITIPRGRAGVPDAAGRRRQPGVPLFNITNASGNLALADNLFSAPTWNVIVQTASGNTTLTLPTSTNLEHEHLFGQRLLPCQHALWQQHLPL